MREERTRLAFDGERSGRVAHAGADLEAGGAGLPPPVPRPRRRPPPTRWHPSRASYPSSFSISHDANMAHLNCKQ